MPVSDEKLREVMNNLIKEHGLEGAIEYVSTADYDEELKNRAMLILRGEPLKEVTMAEHGDISDMG